jgi:very-short-patch-repair endonuclease
MNKAIIQAVKELCRDLRKRSTRGEQVFWNEVRNREILGKKFLRQYLIFFKYMNQKKFFIADFYCYECRLVVEIDGKSHEYQKEYDELRTYIINNLGIRVLRFKNEEIETDINKVLRRLRVVLNH